MGNICRQSPNVISSQNPPIQQIQPPKPEQIKTQAPEKQEEPGQSVDQANQENETLKQEQKKLIKIDDSEFIYENVQKQEKRKSPFDYQILLSSLSDSIIFEYTSCTKYFVISIYEKYINLYQKDILYYNLYKWGVYINLINILNKLFMQQNNFYW